MWTASIRGDRESSRQVTSAGSESEEGGTYGGQRGRTFAKKHRQKMQAIASGSGTPQLGEVRFSTRRAAKVTNYDDDQDLGISDEEESDTATPSYYYVEDNTPAIDQILNHRLKEGIGMIGCVRFDGLSRTDTFLAEASTSDKQDYEFYVCAAIDLLSQHHSLTLTTDQMARPSTLPCDMASLVGPHRT